MNKPNATKGITGLTLLDIVQSSPSPLRVDLVGSTGFVRNDHCTYIGVTVRGSSHCRRKQARHLQRWLQKQQSIVEHRKKVLREFVKRCDEDRALFDSLDPDRGGMFSLAQKRKTTFSFTRSESGKTVVYSTPNRKGPDHFRNKFINQLRNTNVQ